MKKTLPEKQNGFPGVPFLSAAATYLSVLFTLYFIWGPFSAPGGAVFRPMSAGFPPYMKKKPRTVLLGTVQGFVSALAEFR
ncbi:MAG: hypothetical protein E7424_04660 [Ruminococcaceae bacterium]|nr:hypothetical protein [Oscillospiraceae bacterium]